MFLCFLSHHNISDTEQFTARSLCVMRFAVEQNLFDWPELDVSDLMQCIALAAT